MIKLQKYINNSRTFQNDIINNQIFIDFNNFLNQKIIETLFDFNIISNSIINEAKKDILSLDEEQNEIENILNNIINNKKMNINCNINGVKENDKDIDKDINNNNIFNINNKLNASAYTYENIITNSTNNSNNNSNSNSMISSTNNSCQSSTHKRTKVIFSEDEKSLTLICKEIKNDNKDINTISISLLNNDQLYDFLNYVDDKENNYLKTDINKENIIQIFEEIISKYKNNFNESKNKDEYYIKNICLRKNVCLKLYKVFRFLFKKYKINGKKIKKFCKYIENKARMTDCEMGIKYKEYILNILKKLSTYG